jgi:hypothetical protein
MNTTEQTTPDTTPSASAPVAAQAAAPAAAPAAATISMAEYEALNAKYERTREEAIAARDAALEADAFNKRLRDAIMPTHGQHSDELREAELDIKVNEAIQSKNPAAIVAAKQEREEFRQALAQKAEMAKQQKYYDAVNKKASEVYQTVATQHPSLFDTDSEEYDPITVNAIYDAVSRAYDESLRSGLTETQAKKKAEQIMTRLVKGHNADKINQQRTEGAVQKHLNARNAHPELPSGTSGAGMETTPASEDDAFAAMMRGMGAVG